MNITVRLNPRSSKNLLIELPDGTYKAYVTQPPVEGAANRALISVISDYFRVAPSRIKIIRGLTNRTKTIELPD